MEHKLGHWEDIWGKKNFSSFQKSQPQETRLVLLVLCLSRCSWLLSLNFVLCHHYTLSVYIVEGLDQTKWSSMRKKGEYCSVADIKAIILEGVQDCVDFWSKVSSLKSGLFGLWLMIKSKGVTHPITLISSAKLFPIKNWNF